MLQTQQKDCMTRRLEIVETLNNISVRKMNDAYDAMALKHILELNNIALASVNKIHADTMMVNGC